MAGRSKRERSQRCGPRRGRAGRRGRGGGRAPEARGRPVHDGAAPARRAAAARPPPDQRGAELRQPADGADRLHDRRRAVGQPQHDVPAAATARGARPDRGQLGAPRAALAALLLADRRRARRVRAPRRGGAARSSTPSSRRSTRSSTRCTAREDGLRARAPCRCSRRRRSRCGRTSIAGPRSSRVSRTSSSARPGWPAEGERVSWESSPGGRGRVTEKVVERACGQLHDDGLRVRADGPPDAAGGSAHRPAPRSS